METVGRVVERGRQLVRQEPLQGAYFWLAAFLIIYCARPEDWIPGLYRFPIAKISGGLAVLALLFSLDRTTAPVSVSKHCGGYCKVRLPIAVVPTTREQSATASATDSNCSAFLRTDDPPTADLASRKPSL